MGFFKVTKCDHREQTRTAPKIVTLRWFAFSKMDIGAIDMLTRLEGMKVGGIKQ